MLNEKEIKELLTKLAAGFAEAYKRKDYRTARYNYEVAKIIAVYVKAPTELMLELFGQQDKDEEKQIDGLFRMKDVQNVLEKCWKNGDTRETGFLAKNMP